MKQKFLFFFLNTGGGHLSTAKAIINYYETYYDDKVNCELIDGFSRSKFLRLLIVKGYLKLQFRAIWIYEALYFFHKFNIIAKITTYIIKALVTNWLKSVIINERPDKIIIVHFFLTTAINRICKDLGLNIPIIQIVTDPYTPPPIWFLEERINYVVFSSQARDIAVSNGIDSKNIEVFSTIINLKYLTRLLPDEILTLKKEYGYSTNKKNVLIIGGGDGLPGTMRILDSINSSIENIEISIVCGKNYKLYNQILKKSKDNVCNKVFAYEFVDFVYELINMSDIVITKGGPSILAEILSCGKIPIITTYLWEQEKGNVNFILSNKLGIYEKVTPKIILFLKSYLLVTGQSSMDENLKRFNMPSGLINVANYIYLK